MGKSLMSCFFDSQCLCLFSNIFSLLQIHVNFCVHCLQEATNCLSLTVHSVADSSSGRSRKSMLRKTKKSPTTVEKKLPYECRVCDKSFSLESELTEHLYSHIEAAPKLETVEMNSVITFKLLDCTWCYEQFESADELTEHLKLHGDRRPHVCDCGQRLATAEKLTKHKLVHNKSRRRHEKSGNTACMLNNNSKT